MHLKTPCTIVRRHAEVECSAIHEYPPVLQNTESDESSTDYINNENKESEEDYHKEIEYTEGLELSITRSSERSVSGGLSVEYQGIGASANIMGYIKSQSETVTKFKGKTQKQIITKKISIPPKCCRSVVLVHRYQRKECPVKNVKLSFPKNAKIKCDVHDNRKADPKSQTKDKPYIKDVLKDYIEDTPGGDRLTAKLEGKYVWVETSIYVDVGAPKLDSLSMNWANSWTMNLATAITAC